MNKQMALRHMAATNWLAGLKEAIGSRHQAEESHSSWENQLLNQVAQTRTEWQNLYSVYNEVSDPRVVEHVILQIKATESRYGYLLQLAKEAKLREDLILLK